MAYITIPALPLGSALTGLEQFESVQSSVSVKLTANQLKAFVSSDPTFVVADAATNTVSNAATLEHTTSGTVAAGFGVGLAFDSENDAGAVVTGMDLQAICTDPASSVEDFDYAVRLMIEGSLTEVLRVTSGYRLGLGTSAPAATFHGVASDTNVNSVAAGLRIAHATSSGAAGNGIGVGIEFAAENDAGVLKLGAAIDALQVDVATGAEDFDLVFSLMQNGASVAEVARMRSNGNFGIGTSAPSAKLDVVLNDANNTSPVTVARFTHGTSGVPGAGIGTAVDLVTETSSNNFEIGGAIYTEATNVAPTLEDFDMAFALMIDGIAGVEVMRVTSNKFLGVNTTPQTTIHGFREDAATNTVTPVLRIAHGTINSPAAGFGTSIQIESETAPGNFEIGGTIESVATAVTALTEEFNLVFKTMTAGAPATEKLRVGEVVYTPQPFGAGTLPTADAWIHAGAGTATTALMDLDPGVLLATPFQGAVEYEGRSLYFTPDGIKRSVLQAMQMYQLNADFSRTATITTIQSLFGKAVAVQAGTRYEYEINATISKAGIVAAAIQYALGLGGGATLTAHDYEVISTFPAASTTPTAANLMQNRITTGFGTLVNVTAASAAAGAVATLRIRGSFDVSVAGTIDFSFALSAAQAASALNVVAGSNVMLWPVGAVGADTQIGDWV